METNKRLENSVKVLSVILGIILLVFLLFIGASSTALSLVSLIIWSIAIIVFFTLIYFSFEIYKYFKDKQSNTQQSNDLTLALTFDEAIQIAENMIHDPNYLDYPVRGNSYTTSLGDNIKNTIFVYSAEGTFEKNKEYNVFINLNYPHRKALLVNPSTQEFYKVLHGMPVDPVKEPKKVSITERPTPFGPERYTETVESTDDNNKNNEKKKEDLE